MAVKINKGFGQVGAINMTPMIDCVFLLLLYFLVATRLQDEDENYINVKLPEASQAVPLTIRPKTFVIGVDRQGRYFVSQRQVTGPQLLEILHQAAANNPGRQSVEIRADKRCDWEYVVNVINYCLRAGIRDYRTLTAPPNA